MAESFYRFQCDQCLRSCYYGISELDDFSAQCRGDEEMGYGCGGTKHLQAWCAPPSVYEALAECGRLRALIRCLTMGNGGTD